MSETQTETEPVAPTPETPEQPDQPVAPEQPEPVAPESPETAPGAPETPAEPAPDVQPPATEPEPQEPAQQPAAPSSYAVSEAQARDLDKESKRHLSRLKAILSDFDNDVLECNFCNPDLRGYLYKEELQHPRDEIQAVMIRALMPDAAPDLIQAQDTSMCDRCNGEGENLTGSKNPRYRTKTCSKCNGFGYFPPPGVVQNGTTEHADAPALVAAGVGGPVLDDLDAFGSPRLLSDGRDNPNYGRMPQYKDPQFP